MFFVSHVLNNYVDQEVANAQHVVIQSDLFGKITNSKLIDIDHVMLGHVMLGHVMFGHVMIRQSFHSSKLPLCLSQTCK